MHVHFVLHEAFEAAGGFDEWAQARGHARSWSRVHAGEPLPDATGFDLLVVMGGPQSPATTRAECAHFDAAAELALIRRAAAAGKAVIGVCLGAQLLGEALGARFERSPEREIGLFPIALTSAGLADPLFAPLGPRLDVGHWHRDMPGLTREAVVIAASEGCPRQIIRYGDRLFGLQCHLELTPEAIGALIEASPELPTLAGHRFVQQAPALRAIDCAAMNAALFGILDRLEAALGDVGG